MSSPPDYAPRHQRRYAPPLAAALTDEVPRWFGHMDSSTAMVRAFEGGLKDGQTLSLGMNRIPRGGEILELHYMRGFVIGTEDWKRLNPAPFELYQRLLRDEREGTGTERLAEHITSVLAAARNPPIPSLRQILPSAWSAPAYLPLPRARAAQPPLHSRPSAGAATPGDTVSIPQIPLPEGVDCTTLASLWGPQLEQLLRLKGFGCWLSPESTRMARVSSMRTAASARKMLRDLFTDRRLPDIVEPRSPAANLFGSVFVKGSLEQIEVITRAHVLVAPDMCFIAFPNLPRESDFIATFQSQHYARHQGVTVIRSIARAFSTSDKAIEVCVNAGLLPEMVFTTITVEYVLSRGRHLWNVIMPFPRRPGLQVGHWRHVCDNLAPEDGAGGSMTRVFLECAVCGCWKHEADVCPTRAYDDWKGAVV